MLAAMVPRRGVHSVETHGQRTRPDTSFPKHRASSCRDCLWDRLHEPHAPFLLGWRTHVVGVMSSFFSCFFIVAQTYSLSSYPSRSKQEKPQKFPNSVSFGEKSPSTEAWRRLIPFSSDFCYPITDLQDQKEPPLH